MESGEDQARTRSMTTMKIGPREQQLREQREQQAKEHEAKPGRPRSRQSKAIPENDKYWRQQLRATKAASNRKDRRK
jgi:hypothetical protein